MSSNGVGLREAIVHAPIGDYGPYKYRSKMGLMNSAEYTSFFDDFIAKVTTNVPTGWSAAVIDTGATATQSTTAGSLGATGGLTIASDGTTEGAAVYLPKAVQLTVGKRFFMEVRVQTSTAAETDLQFGLSDLTATTNPEDLWTTTAANLVTFGTVAGSAYPSLLADASNSGTSAQTQTVKALTDATWYTLGLSYDGKGHLKGFINGVDVLDWSSAATTIPTGVALAPFIGARTGATASNIVTFDYARFVIER